MGLSKVHAAVRTLIFFIAIASLLIQPASSTLQFSVADYGDGRDAALEAGIPDDCSQPVDRNWITKVRNIRWAAYSPPSRGMGQTAQLEAKAVERDLQVLRKAGFTGLITYGSGGFLGRQFLALAERLDFHGVIMGIWNPTNGAELSNALDAADRPIVLGYSIGNEGLSETRKRYSLLTLCAAISGLRAAAEKPVTTSEVIETYYSRSELLWVGDWLFPISHPYWHNTKYPLEAVRWEEEQYSKLAKRTDKFIFFKEVGLPSHGAYGLSETNQDLYYRGLERTDVEFAYFEAFDQPSKSYNSVEPHWGIFRSDLKPKLLAWNLMGYQVFTLQRNAQNLVMQCPQSHPEGCMEMNDVEGFHVGVERGREYRSLMSFDTSALPDQAVVRALKLKIRLVDRVGTDLPGGGMEIKVDICLPSAQFSGGQGRKCVHNAGTLSRSPSGGWYVVEFDARVYGSINLTGVTQFRLRTQQAGSVKVPREIMTFSSEGTDTPVLVVRYELP